MKVRELMTKEVITVHPDTFPKDAFAKLKEHRFRHLVVLDDDKKVAGVLSILDFRPLINYMASGEGLKENDFEQQLYNVGHVKDIMTPYPIAVLPATDVSEVAQIMLNLQIHCLPVTENDKLVGIITSSDILSAVAKKKLIG